jgi:hypothetical protein
MKVWVATAVRIDDNTLLLGIGNTKAAAEAKLVAELETAFDTTPGAYDFLNWAARYYVTVSGACEHEVHEELRRS